jgi:uncharacterized membrane protein YdjX (TVP38/TMEM64 family)
MAAPHPQRFQFRRLIPLGLLLLAGLVFVLCGGRRYLSFAAIAEHREFLLKLVADWELLAVLGYIGVYAVLTALSVPGAILLTLAGGFLFGAWVGASCALLGATLGATVVFLAARAGRYGLTERAGSHIARLEAGFREDAFSYLLCLRLVPLLPFWLVNLIAGFTGMGVASFVAATFLGMIPGAVVYASLGSGLGTWIAQPNIHWWQPSMLLPPIGLAALALLPVVYKRWRGRRQEPAQ